MKATRPSRSSRESQTTRKRASGRCADGRARTRRDRRTFTDPSWAWRLRVPRPSCGSYGPHDPNVPPAPRIDPERLDGLPPRAAREGPGDLRPCHLEGTAARECRELLRPHGPDDPGDPVRPLGDGTGDRDAETGTFFGRPPLRASCGSVTTTRPSWCGPSPTRGDCAS